MYICTFRKEIYVKTVRNELRLQQSENRSETGVKTIEDINVRKFSWKRSQRKKRGKQNDRNKKNNIQDHLLSKPLR